MSFQRIIFENGLRVINVPIKNIASVTILVLIRTGTKYEKKKEKGISHFLEHMLFKGTKKRPNSLDISKELDGIGGIYNAFTSKDFTGYFVKVNSLYLELGLDIVSDIFLHSLLKEEEIEKEKRVILEEIKMIEDNPMQYIEILWEKLLYKDQPAGWEISGTKETILRIKRENLINYLKNHYLTSNTIIGIAGKINLKKTINLIRKYFKKMKKGEEAEREKTKETQKAPQKLFYKKDVAQAHLGLGFRAFNMFHPKRYALEILSVILGGNTSSRFFQELREKRGLAYYISTSYERNPDTGYLVTYTGVDHKKTKEVINLILEEYQKIKEKGPDLKEIKRAKEFLKGRIKLSLEESDNVASFYSFQELFEKKILTPEKIIRKIEKVSLLEVKEAAKEIFRNNRLNLVIISPSKEIIPKKLKIS